MCEISGHRPPHPPRMADLIVAVDLGRIAAVGTHDELLAASGLYAELSELQAASPRIAFSRLSAAPRILLG